MAFGALALWPLAEAGAITIAINSAPNNTVPTPVGSTTSQRAAAHRLSITDSGGATADGLGAGVDASTRFTGVVAADRSNPGRDRARSVTPTGDILASVQMGTFLKSFDTRKHGPIG